MYRIIAVYSKAHYLTVWKPVERDVKIPFNMDTTSLQIKTDSLAGSENAVNVQFFTAEKEYIGSVYLDFFSPPEYAVGGCMNNRYHPLPTNLIPSEVTKVWQINKLPGLRITVQCNGLTVVDFTLTDETCDDHDWSIMWNKQIKQIDFPARWDDASDEYRAKPGSPLIIFDIKTQNLVVWTVVHRCFLNK